MDDDLQIANKIIKKEFGTRRHKLVNFLDKSENKCIMIEISDCHSPSIVLYYNNKNEDNVEEILKTCQFGNALCFPHNDDITRINLSLYWIGGDEPNKSTI